MIIEGWSWAAFVGASSSTRQDLHLFLLRIWLFANHFSLLLSHPLFLHGPKIHHLKHLFLDKKHALLHVCRVRLSSPPPLTNERRFVESVVPSRPLLLGLLQALIRYHPTALFLASDDTGERQANHRSPGGLPFSTVHAERGPTARSLALPLWSAFLSLGERPAAHLYTHANCSSSRVCLLSAATLSAETERTTGKTA